MKNLLLIVAALSLASAVRAEEAAPQADHARYLPLPGMSESQSLSALKTVNAAEEEGGKRMENARTVTPGEVNAPYADKADSGLVKPAAPKPFDAKDPAVAKSIDDALAARRAKPLSAEEKLEAPLTAAAAGGAFAMAGYIFAGLAALAGANLIIAAVMAVACVAGGAYLVKDAVDRFKGSTRVDEKPLSGAAN